MKCSLNKLRETRGDASLTYGLVFTIVLCLILLFLMEFLNIAWSVKSARSALDHAVLSAAADNALAAYGGIREGNSGLWEYRDGSASVMYYVPAVSVSDAEEKLKDPAGPGLIASALGLEKRDSEGALLYRISGLSVSADVPPPDAPLGSRAVLSSSCDLFIPLYFLKLDTGPVIRLSVSSSYLPKF